MTGRLALLSIALLAFGFSSESVADEMAPPEMRKNLDSYCATCHGTDLVAQQRLTEAQWRGVLEKMVGWGSTLPADRLVPLSRALHHEFGTDALPYQPGRITAKDALAQVSAKPDPVLAGGNPTEGSTLYAQSCAACHGATGLGQIGLALVDKPVLDQPSAFKHIVLKGRRGMPPLAHLEPDQIADLLAFLRQL